jgi:hypothetical protein
MRGNKKESLDKKRKAKKSEWAKKKRKGECDGSLKI